MRQALHIPTRLYPRCPIRLFIAPRRGHPLKEKSILKIGMSLFKKAKPQTAPEHVEALLKLARQYRVDLLEVDGVKVVISRHDLPQDTTSGTSAPAAPAQTPDDDEELFWSAG